MKDLPYFKFYVSDWSNGRITLCSYTAQGLFANLCALYWSQGGNVRLADAKRRHSDGTATAWKELISEEIIRISGDRIKIHFLDEQLSERKELSEQNRKNALKGVQIRATAERPLSDGIAVASNKEEKRREENELTIWLNDFLKRKSSNTMDLRFMVKQWKEAGIEDIKQQIESMKVAYKMQNLVFPTKIETLTESLMNCNWVEKVKELDPHRIAEDISKARRNGKEREPDTIGTSEPGSLG